MKLTALEFWGAAAVLVAVSSLVVPRIPRVRAWLNEAREQKILAAPLPVIEPPSVMLARFYDGPVPTHEDCGLLPAEETDFAEAAAELGYGWIRDAVRGAEKAREQQ